MKKLFTLFLVCLSHLSFAQIGWDYLGLNNTYTTDLTIYNDTMYASTYDGIYKFSISEQGAWIPCGMQGRHVVQTFVPDYQTFICLVEIDSSYRTQIYKSIDGGNNFNLMTTDTSEVNNYQFLDAMAHPPGNYDTLYFLNHHLKTYDGGVTWDTIHSQRLTDRFIAVNPYNTNQLIIGGETMILSPYIQVSNDRGNTWSIPAMNGYFAGDNCVHDISFDYNGDWYAAGEGVVCVTSDSGNTWTQIYNSWNGPPNFSLYNWDIELGHYGIYVTGSNSNAVEVPFIWRYPLNTWWNTESTPPVDSMNPEMRCLAYIYSPMGDDVFVGGHGVYLFHILMGGIEEHDKNEIAVYPNPFYDVLNIDLENNKSFSNYSVSLFNSYGQLIFTENNLDNFSKINLNNIKPGLYYVQLSEKNGNILKHVKIIKL